MASSRAHEVQAGYALGIIGSETVVAWAVNALVEGFDSPSLCILAGLEPPFDPEEVARLLKFAFRELSITPLPRT